MERSRRERIRRVGVVVAHPDDETLWAGGTLLMHSEWECSLYTLCRMSDPDRSIKFGHAAQRLGASGAMADLDDGPEQKPLSKTEIQGTILQLLRERRFDLVITHSPQGEYTRHLRHEETGTALLKLWREGKIQTARIWIFAYEDGKGSYHPRAERKAHLTIPLSESIWKQKQKIVTQIYGFSQNSWEARISPKVEAFWCFDSPEELRQWHYGRGASR